MASEELNLDNPLHQRPNSKALMEGGALPLKLLAGLDYTLDVEICRLRIHSEDGPQLGAECVRLPFARTLPGPVFFQPLEHFGLGEDAYLR